MRAGAETRIWASLMNARPYIAKRTAKEMPSVTVQVRAGLTLGLLFASDIKNTPPRANGPAGPSKWELSAAVIAPPTLQCNMGIILGHRVATGGVK